jgi:hypothetical protein
MMMIKVALSCLKIACSIMSVCCCGRSIQVNPIQSNRHVAYCDHACSKQTYEADGAKRDELHVVALSKTHHLFDLFREKSEEGPMILLFFGKNS